MPQFPHDIAIACNGYPTLLTFHIFHQIAETQSKAVAGKEHYRFYVMPISLAANLSNASFSSLCGIIHLVTLPIFLVMAALHTNHKQSQNFWLARSSNALVFGAVQLLGSLPFAIFNTLFPEFLNKQGRNLLLNLEQISEAKRF